MSSGKDLVSSAADVIVVAGLIAAGFVFDAPGVFAALWFYGAFRHMYALICVDSKVNGSKCLCDEPFWNVLDLVMVGSMFVIGYHFVKVTYGWPHFAAMLYVALRHVIYACWYQPPVGSQSATSSFKELADVALDFTVLVFFVHNIFMLPPEVKETAGKAIHEHSACGLALAGLVVYALFRHLFGADCVACKSEAEEKNGLEKYPGLEAVQYLSEQLFYNLWDLLVIVTSFAAGFAWGHAAPFVVGVLLVIARFVLWACIKANYKLEEQPAQA